MLVTFDGNDSKTAGFTWIPKGTNTEYVVKTNVEWQAQGVKSRCSIDGVYGFFKPTTT